VATLQLLTILLLALYILNLGYVFDGSFTRLKEFSFVSTSLSGLEKPGDVGNRFKDSWLGQLPMPVPKQYLRGVDLLKMAFEDYSQPSYLRGEWKYGGWWYYHIYGLAVKMSHGSQLMVLLAILAVVVQSWQGRHELKPKWEQSQCEGLRPKSNGMESAEVRIMGDWHARDLVMLLTPAVVLLALVSSQLAFNHDVRYVMPVLAFLHVFCGATAWWFPRCCRRF
jgi:hypothetical protein